MLQPDAMSAPVAFYKEVSAAGPWPSFGLLWGVQK